MSTLLLTEELVSELIPDDNISALRIVLTILFVLISVALSALVLLQEGKTQGLGVISGAAETYWGNNLGRSMEGVLVKITRVLAVLFILLAVVLNLTRI